MNVRVQTGLFGGIFLMYLVLMGIKKVKRGRKLKVTIDEVDRLIRANNTILEEGLLFNTPNFKKNRKVINLDLERMKRRGF